MTWAKSTTNHKHMGSQGYHVYIYIYIYMYIYTYLYTQSYNPCFNLFQSGVRYDNFARGHDDFSSSPQNISPWHILPCHSGYSKAGFPLWFSQSARTDPGSSALVPCTDTCCKSEKGRRAPGEKKSIGLRAVRSPRHVLHGQRQDRLHYEKLRKK